MSEDPRDLLPKPGNVVTTERHSYKVIKMLGTGGYGTVLEVEREDEGRFAMKCEFERDRSVIIMDVKVLTAAADRTGLQHFVKLYDSGYVTGRFKFLVMSLIGMSLWDLRSCKRSRRLGLNTGLKVAEQTLLAIEELHRLGFIHRDIKPGNFAVGRAETPEEHTVFILDFGLSRRYALSEEQDLLRPRKHTHFRGTVRYAPMAALRMDEMSRKDDLEGWLYVMTELMDGRLPWRHGGDQRETVLAMKMEIRTDPIALERLFQSCPQQEFTKIMRYVDSLTYYDVPDYAYIQKILHDAAVRLHITPTEPVEWDPDHLYSFPQISPGPGTPQFLEHDAKPRLLVINPPRLRASLVPTASSTQLSDHPAK